MVSSNCPAFLHHHFVFIALLLGLFVVVNCAPRSKSKAASPPTVYDQKQTGDYNIQLHLKDFQIIAVLADDSLADLGDYDYNYDYSDFTVKPGGSTSTTTTLKPSQNEGGSAQASLLQNLVKPSTIKPIDGHPYPILQPSTINSGNAASNQQQTTTKPVKEQEVTLLGAKPLSSTTTQPPKIADITQTTTTTSAKPIVEIIESNTQKFLPLLSSEENLLLPNAPDKIKVQIIQSPINGGEPNVGIVPSEDVAGDDEKIPGIQLGEILHYRRCASGFARDKRGRCRKVRRPVSHMPFDIGRIASSLAARLRSAPLGETDDLTTAQKSDLSLEI